MIEWPTWTVLLTDLASNPIADISDSCIRPSLTRRQNDADTLEWTLYLDDQAAYQIVPLKTLIKVWRDVPGYTATPADAPTFVGVVGGRTRNAQARTAQYTAYAPLWRLRFRYHIDPHDWSWETGRGRQETVDPMDPFPRNTVTGEDPSVVMWTMIQFTNSVVDYTALDHTGIVQGTFADYSGADYPVLIGPRYDRGQNTWDLVSEIVSLPGMPDIDPSYIHVEGSRDLMRFGTTLRRGSDLTFSLDYRTGDRNITDLTEDVAPEVGGYANYVVVQGQGDTNTDQTIVRASGPGQYVPSGAIDGFFGDQNYFAGTRKEFRTRDGAWVPDLIGEYGLYMTFEKMSGATDDLVRSQIAQQRLLRTMYPIPVYQASLARGLMWECPHAFDVGDTVRLNCDRDSFQVSDVAQMVSELTIAREPDRSETVAVTLIDPDSYKTYT